MMGRRKPVRLALADPAGGLEAVHDGHLAVHEHGVEGGLGEPFERLGAVVGERDLGARALEQALGDMLIDRVVVDHQDAPPLKGDGGRGRAGGADDGQDLARGVALDGADQELRQAQRADGFGAHGIRRMRPGGQIGFRAEEREQHHGGAGEARPLAQRREEFAGALVGHELIDQHGVDAAAGVEPGERGIDAGFRVAVEAEEADLAGKALAAGGDVIDDEHALADAGGVLGRPLGDMAGAHGEPEGRAHAGRAAHAHLALHEAGEALDDGEPEAAAAVVPGGGGVDLGEGLEQAIEPVGGNADAAVGHLDAHLDLLAQPPGRAGDEDVALVGELDGIADEVQHDLPQAPGIAVQVDRSCRRCRR